MSQKPSNHPPWCDAQQCHPADCGIQHRSAIIEAGHAALQLLQFDKEQVWCRISVRGHVATYTVDELIALGHATRTLVLKTEGKKREAR